MDLNNLLVSVVHFVRIFRLKCPMIGFEREVGSSPASINPLYVACKCLGFQCDLKHAHVRKNATTSASICLSVCNAAQVHAT